MDDNGTCTVERLNHVCIAVRDLEDTLEFYRDLFGLEPSEVRELPDQRVRAALLRVGGTELELIQPTDTDGAIARFIDSRGESLHHICFEVEDLQGKLDLLAGSGARLIDRTPRQGLAGMIAFLHPRSTRGVLVELVDRDTVGA